MAYSIGDVSRVMGITTSALHYYEKEGIIDTPKVESGRRYYEEAEVCRLISVKKYRAMGVPVRDIAAQFAHDGMSGGQVMARMREKREEALAFIRQYTGLVGDIDRLLALGEEALFATGVVDIRPAEEMLAFLPSSGGRIPQDRREQEVAKRWLEAMPAASVAICREAGKERAAHGMAIGAARAGDFGLDEGAPGVKKITGGMALHAIVVCGEDLYDQPDVIFRPILSFAREHRFVPRDMMWGTMLFVDCSGGTRRHYFDTYMVFE